MCVNIASYKTILEVKFLHPMVDHKWTLLNPSKESKIVWTKQNN
jgi:hypothetical protein